MILIDTNIFIDHLRNHPPATQYFETLMEREDVLFSAITETELLAGKANDYPEKREKLLHFLNRWNKVIVTNQIAVLAGDICRRYDSRIADAIIAATAMISNSQLITRNVKDFQKISGLHVQAPY